MDVKENSAQYRKFISVQSDRRYKIKLSYCKREVSGNMKCLFILCNLLLLAKLPE